MALIVLEVFRNCCEVRDPKCIVSQKLLVRTLMSDDVVSIVSGSVEMNTVQSLHQEFMDTLMCTVPCLVTIFSN